MLTAQYGFAAPRTVVDVRDVAKACVLAATHDLARGNRFLLVRAHPNGQADQTGRTAAHERHRGSAPVQVALW